MGYACEDMANDIKVNLKGQSDRMQNQTLNSLYDIQNQAGVSGKLLMMIKQQRQRNKYVLWGVYFLLMLLALFVFYRIFGFLIPDLSSEVEVTDDVKEDSAVEGAKL